MREVPEVQFAAGGIVWDKKGDDRRLALVHRAKYDDWSLPKGKPDPGESIGETARREVREELGIDVEFGNFAGTTHYPLANGRIKVVLYWHMIKSPGESTFKPNREIDAIEWLASKDAMKKLTHAVERELLRQNVE
ncbi:MAG: NUDIX hydrolase [Verrucomicrobia subdivision 3 bacterium]|nr:NUDIX hydrolase [Limisphaerales bacterium]